MNEPERRPCPRCQIDNPSDASFCRDCGGKLNNAPPAAQPSAMPAPQALPPGAINSPLTGTLMAASKPPAVPQTGGGTLASARETPFSAPDTPPPAAERGLDSPYGHHPSPAAPIPPGVAVPAASPDHAAAANPVQNAARLCRSCGGSSGPSARFCQLCGLPFEKASGERPRSNPAIAPPSSLPDAELVVIAQDGSPGRRYPLATVQTIIGNGEVDINLRKDPYVSPVHAEISYRNGRFHLFDRGSLNGVFVRLGGSVPLRSGDLLLVGLGVLRFEIVEEAERNLAPQTRNGTRVFGTPPAPRYARLTTQTVEGVARDRYYLARAETVLGREVGDIVFTDDPFMSRRHAAIRRDPNTNRFSIRDLGSSNGTFVALREEHVLSPGDHIRIGQHLFRLDVRGNG